MTGIDRERLELLFGRGMGEAEVKHMRRTKFEMAKVREQVRQMVAEGKKYADIIHALHVSANMVAAARKELKQARETGTGQAKTQESQPAAVTAGNPIIVIPGSQADVPQKAEAIAVALVVRALRAVADGLEEMGVRK